MQPVIKWGRAWLEDNSFDRRARDVALTAALAHCDLAGVSLLSSHSLHVKSHAACLSSHGGTSLCVQHVSMGTPRSKGTIGYSSLEAHR